MIDIIKENIFQIMTLLFTFLTGIGIGAAINEFITNWQLNKQEDKEHETNNRNK